MLPLGSELWTIRFNGETQSYIPWFSGVVKGVRGDEYLVKGRWQTFGYPHFGRRADAEAWIAEHPFNAPKVK